MKFKKLVCIAVALSMVVWTFAACGEKEEAKEDTFQTKITSDYSFAGDVQDYLDNVDSKYAYGIAKTLAYDEKYFDNELGWRTSASFPALQLFFIPSSFEFLLLLVYF